MKVTIRPLIETDAYVSVKWRNDPEVFKYTGNTYNHEITIESELEWIRKVISNPEEYRCAILVDGIYVGNVYLTEIIGGNANYHIFIGERCYWGKGIAKEASRQIVDYGFNKLHLNSIRLRVRKQNIRAISLYRSLGFKYICDVNDWMVMELNNEFRLTEG